MYDLLIIGGGAAGFFTAINCAEEHPKLKIAILEKNKEVLQKVRISGGGRCNLTNATFTPAELVRNYPRGHKELLSPFHRFMCGDAMAWFEAHGVALKIEEDGRVFPASNTSETIVNCFLQQLKTNDIALFTGQNVKEIIFEEGLWRVATPTATFISRNLVITTGSNPKMWQLLEGLGHSIVPPVPSLFTFQTPIMWIKELQGIAVTAEVSLLDTNLKPLKIAETAPLLFTHKGFSGPAILRASAWGARLLAELNYRCVLAINFTANAGASLSFNTTFEALQHFKQQNGRKAVVSYPLYNLPKRLWLALLAAVCIPTQTLWAELNKQQQKDLALALSHTEVPIDGKATFKDEFVTAGGVKLSEVNFKNYESKLHKGLYLAGEVLDIDAITGGFNFQNAWTGGYIIAQSIT